MLTLYIVRHGETEWNKEDRIQGRLDSSLTNKGRLHAKLLGESLKDVDFTRIISSPSQRTLETAQLIKGNRDIPLIEDENLMEMHMGPWQGLTKEEIKAQYPHEYDCFMYRPDIYQNNHAETFADMQNRAQLFLSELNQIGLSGNLLVVSHGLFIKSLFTIFKGTELKDLNSEPTVEGTSLTIVKLTQNGAEFVLEGDMSHANGKDASLPLN